MNPTILSFVLLLLLIVIAYWVDFLSDMKSVRPSKYEDEYYGGKVDLTIPKVIVLTIKDKSKIPAHILNQYKQYAFDYTLLIFDDNDCREFLKNHYDEEHLRVFEQIKLGAHKADFFRYAYLYKYGGFYFDVKTVLLKNVNDIFPIRRDRFYMMYTFDSFANGEPLIYNGVIVTFPRNPIIKQMLQTIFDREKTQREVSYHQNLKDATNITKTYLNRKDFKLGVNRLKTDQYDLIIYNENARPGRTCADPDRWGFCSFIENDKGERIMRTRDPHYTPNYT